MVEKFTFTGKMEQVGAGHPVLLSGSWADVTGAIGAHAKYQMEGVPLGFDVGSEDLPPSGSYPGRMNLQKKQQIVDRMALRFVLNDDGAVVGDGDGGNRVGRYSLEIHKCERAGRSWDVEMTRIYTGPALPRQDSVDGETTTTTKKKRSHAADVSSAAALALASADQGPRKPRAAAPPKGAWGAQAAAAVKKDEQPAQKSRKKNNAPNDSSSGANNAGEPPRPCVAVVFPSEERPASAKRCPTVAAAHAALDGLVLEQDAAVRVPSDQGDGVLFPPPIESQRPPPLSKHQRPPLPFSAGHVVLLDVDPASAKPRSWRPSVCAFATASRAAHYCLHVARTCGPRLNSLAWLAFPDTAASDARLRMHLLHDGSFDPTLPIADMAALEKSATAY